MESIVHAPPTLPGCKDLIYYHNVVCSCSFRSVELLCPDKIFGFIINKPSTMSVFGVNMPIRSPHWFAVRRIANDYYNLDSKLSAPQCLGDTSKLLEFLKDSLEASRTQLLLVVRKEVAEARLWREEDLSAT